MNKLPTTKPEAFQGSPKAEPENDDARRIVELTSEVDRLIAELSYRDRYIVELEAGHAEQMRVRAETEARAVADALNLRNTLNAFYATSSWRITRPLRVATRVTRKLLDRLRKTGNVDALRNDHMAVNSNGLAASQVISIEPDPEAVSTWVGLLVARGIKAS